MGQEEPNLEHFERRLSEMENDLSTLTSSLGDLDNGLKSMTKVIYDECKRREESELRSGKSLQAASEQLGTVVNALLGNLSTPEVPGILAKLGDIKVQIQACLVSISELRTAHAALKKEFEDYKAAMPTAVAMTSLQAKADDTSGKITYFVGWFGGVTAAIIVAWKIVEVIGLIIK